MTATNETFLGVRAVLASSLQLGERGGFLDRNSMLLGGLPELDSMAVVQVLAALEDHFGLVVNDDEISAETFATLGRLADFVQAKLTA